MSVFLPEEFRCKSAAASLSPSLLPSAQNSLHPSRRLFPETLGLLLWAHVLTRVQVSAVREPRGGHTGGRPRRARAPPLVFKPSLRRVEAELLPASPPPPSACLCVACRGGRRHVRRRRGLRRRAGRSAGRQELQLQNKRRSSEAVKRFH